MTNYKVQVQPAGREFDASPEQTVLGAALQSGITLPHGCKNGACGSCKGKVLSGSVHHSAHSPTALTPQEEAAGMALFCSAHPASDLVIEVRIAAALDGVVPRKMPARVERIERVGTDVALLSVKLPASEHMLYRAGQYVDFILGNGVRRSYSIATVPGSGGPLEFHVRHMPGGRFTDALFGKATPGIQERSILRVEGPLGTFYLRDEDVEPIVLLASGTGFAPIKAIAETIFQRGLNRDDAVSGRRARPVVLYWGGRKQSDLYLDGLPRRWEREQENFRYVPVLSEASDDAQWTGRRGFVHQAVMEDLPDLSGHQVYACGVPIMVQSAHRDFVAQCNLHEDNFFSDAFVTGADLAAAAQGPTY
jgi:CDP-4-dehydro-6-deoxyglucose reductase